MDKAARERLGTRRGMQEIRVPVTSDMAADAIKLLQQIMQFLFKHGFVHPRDVLRVASNPSGKRRL